MRETEHRTTPTPHQEQAQADDTLERLRRDFVGSTILGIDVVNAKDGQVELFITTNCRKSPTTYLAIGVRSVGSGGLILGMALGKENPGGSR